MMVPTAALLIALMTSSLMQPVASSLINALPGRGVRREGKGQESGILPLLALFLVMKAISRRQYNKMDHVDKKF